MTDDTHVKARNLLAEISVQIENAMQDQTITTIQAIGILETIKNKVCHSKSEAALKE